MGTLSRDALTDLRLAGFSRSRWVATWFGGGVWGGDRCGCPDDRCSGFHHEPSEPCGCLPSLLREAMTRG